jgi:hypothetical protein
VATDWSRVLQQVAVLAIFIWAVVGIIDDLGGLNGTSLLKLQLAGWRLGVASFLSLASVALLRSLKLIDRTLERAKQSSDL